MPFTHNHVTIAGNLTRDPEVREVGGRAIASFSLAVNRSWRDRSGERQEQASFFDCEAWERTAELIGQYLTKGKPVFVEGRLQQDTWTTPQGEKRSKIKIVCSNVQFLGAGRSDETPRTNVSSMQSVTADVTAGVDDEDVPF